MNTTRIAMISLLAVAAAAAAPSSVFADEGFDLGGARAVRITGRLTDAKTGEPVAGAQVSLEGPYGTIRADSGPDGTFVLDARLDSGFGLVSIAFNHHGYQQKYLETVFRDALRHKVDVTVGPGRTHVKAKRLDTDLACGASETVETRSGEATPLSTVCEPSGRGIELVVRRHRVAVVSDGAFRLHVESGRVEVRDAAGSLEIRVHAPMYPR